MNEPDVLSRAARALRTAHTGEHQGSGFTRARIMVSLHHNRRGRLMRWVIGAPLASVLLVGSAWAQSAGKWPVVWAAMASVFGAAPETNERSDGQGRGVREGRPRGSSEPAPHQAVPAPTPSDGETVEVPAEPPRAEPVPQLGDEAHDRPARPRSSSAPSITAPRVTESSKPEPPKTASPVTGVETPAAVSAPADPELARFRAAHELHFRGDRPREAIAAYAEYLRAFPSGRFVPEARYNTALDYIKIGDKERARQALLPFANGARGGYRQREAEQLLEALK